MGSDSAQARSRRAFLGPLFVLLCCAALAIIGLGVEGRLQPTSLIVPGTPSAKGQELAQEHFGSSSPFAVLLRGPAPAIDRQGPDLVRALHRDPNVTVVSPWDRGAVGFLRPGPRKAIVLLDYHLPLDEAMRETVPSLERTLDEHVHPPLVAVQSGYASVSRALQSESLDATERAELIAAPLLLIVLLLVFRSLVAAAIPLALGALTVLAGRGVLVLLDSVMTIEALSLVVCTMMGLALGVDYSLFIVSRFREEIESQRKSLSEQNDLSSSSADRPSRTRERGQKIPGDDESARARAEQMGGIDYWQAARITRRTAGRTTVVAGATLFISILLSSFLQPGSLLLSLATALVVVTPIAVAIAWLALPPLLALLGERINAGTIGAGAGEGGRSRVAAAADAALRRPALAAALIAVPLALLAAPALAFNTGAPGIQELPSSSPARQATEAIDRAVGPGWEAPFEIVVEAPRGPITTPGRLALLQRAQRRIVERPGVRAVIGPAPIQRAARPLRQLGQRLTSDGPDGVGRLTALGPNLRRAAAAVTRLRAGLARAASGSGLLGEGSERVGDGAAALATALEQAAEGGGQASEALDRLAAGSTRLADGQRTAASAGLALEVELRALLPSLRSKALERARRIATQLEAAARNDPALRPVAQQQRLLVHVLASERDKVRTTRNIAIKLHSALQRLEAGGAKLKEGTGRLAGSASGLKDGLEQLSAGANRLAEGLNELNGGAGALEEGLAEGFNRSYPLQKGLGRAAVRVSAAAGPLSRGAAALRRRSPHLFDSGYFVLSALDGAPPLDRALAAEAVNVEHGGQAARLLVVSTEPFNTAGSRATGAMLHAEAARLAREGNLRSGLSGGAAILNDYASATRSRLPLVIGAIIIITFLLLVAILRAPLLAALAVALNLVSVAAAVGVVTLICKVPAGYPLGGHSYIDTVGAAGIFAVTFGLSIDYSVFLFARMREKYDELTGPDSPSPEANREAIHFGLDKTAGVITGAAAIMIAVFLAFATAPIATVSQLGVGLTVAILLDATVVRIILLPALMLLLGDRVWHEPTALQRLLPGFDLHGAPPGENERRAS